MEYISAEEFLKKPIEIKKVFLDWWVPSVGDLIYITHFKIDDIEVSNDPIIYALKDEDDFRGVKEQTPLFTEGQLKEFIEENTNGKIRIIEFDFDHYNIITWKKNFITNENQLLQAYWKVALEIAKEELNQ